MPNPIDSTKFPLTHKYCSLFHYDDDMAVTIGEAERIAFQIYHNICGRRGVKYEFERFVLEDHDVSEEILVAWVKIAEGK